MRQEVDSVLPGHERSIELRGSGKPPQIYFPEGIETQADNQPIPTRSVRCSGDEWQEVNIKGKKKKAITTPSISASQSNRVEEMQGSNDTQTNGDTQSIKDPQEDINEE